LTGTGARLTGLPAGTVVAVGTGDDFSNPLGAGVVGPGTLVCCLGTAEVTGVVIDRPLIDDSGLLQTTAYPGGGYFLENPGWLAGGAVRWAIETFRIDDLDEFDRLAAEAPAGCDGVLFLPGLSGTTAPEWSAGARGCFYGLTPAHGLAHIARSVLEGCAFAMRDVRTRIGEMQVPLESILLLGGGARSVPWARIRADVAGLPVRIPERVDTSPVAAAMLAAIASGTVAGLGQASSLVSGVFERVGPDPAMADTYDRAWRSYRRLYRSLKPMFAE
jgi:xylulokinase